MKIAQVAPLYESVPPRMYGGTERVVSYLTEELVALGHDVTLFASGDSITASRLHAVCAKSLRTDPCVVDPLARHLVMLEEVARQADAFDVVHFHCDYLHFPLSRRHNYRHLTTLHGRLDIPELAPLYREFAEAPIVSISDAQRDPLPGANWFDTVHHGLPRELHTLHARPGEYLAFLGRFSPEKRADRAIEIAHRAGCPLKLAAKIDRVDREYYREQIQPLLKGDTEYIGEINCREKDEFLGGARALLFPIDWPEPFGLVMIEAMACGVPVIAWRCGSVPEVIEDGVNGFIVDSVDEAVAAIARLDTISRQQCRAIFEQRFDARRMAEDYLRCYRRLLTGTCSNADLSPTARRNPPEGSAKPRGVDRRDVRDTAAAMASPQLPSQREPKGQTAVPRRVLP